MHHTSLHDWYTVGVMSLNSFIRSAGGN